MQSSTEQNPLHLPLPLVSADRTRQVKSALEEDIGSGDITAQLIPLEKPGRASVITRELAVICGKDWVNEVFSQVDSHIQVTWHVQDGDVAMPNQILFEVQGSLRHLLSAERTALNFLQTLSGTATVCRSYAERVKHTRVKLLDTRKTIPGLRIAQKYAVRVGGCFNHRIGLYDAFLIKENHIAACGSIQSAIGRAHSQAPDRPIEVEVENLAELQEALDAKADIIMLDNFTLDTLKEAVALARRLAPACKLEASGGITDNNLVTIAETGVDHISIGSLTKNLKAIDLSMRVIS
jgi:nicotinate-nucleotide pyrophosphorylase (carboxylating)